MTASVPPLTVVGPMYALAADITISPGPALSHRRAGKPPFGTEHVLKYLARYTHRVAISNGRLLSLENGQVRFR